MFLPMNRHMLITCLDAVARGEYGRQLIRNRRTGYASVSAWLRGQYLDNSVLQFPRYTASGILFDIWTRIWSTSNGAFEVFLWFLRC